MSNKHQHHNKNKNAHNKTKDKDKDLEQDAEQQQDESTEQSVDQAAPIKSVDPSTKVSNPEKVLMKFSEHKYYNDQSTPIFEKGKVYELEGGAWIQRWLKRGGEIIDGTIPLPKGDDPNPSQILANGDGKVEDTTEAE